MRKWQGEIDVGYLVNRGFHRLEKSLAYHVLAVPSITPLLSDVQKAYADSHVMHTGPI